MSGAGGGTMRAAVRGCLPLVLSRPMQVFGPVLDADESGLLEADAFYSRRYGGNGRYNTSDLLVLGRPAVDGGRTGGERGDQSPPQARSAARSRGPLA